MKDVLRWIVYGGIFLVPFLVLLVTNSLFFPYITGKNFAFRIIVEVIFAAWILLALYDAQYRPRFSWIAVAFLGFLGVMFFADLFGEYAPKSFWSNFERMEGYVTLVHLFAYFIVTGTMLTTKQLWDRFFIVTLSVAVLLTMIAFGQLGHGGDWRVDATLGNSTYMAVYMLFHVFIAALLWARTKSVYVRYVCATLMVLFAFFVFQTGTRGAVLGLAGGLFLAGGYFVLFAKGYPRIRTYAAGALVTLVVLGGAFVAFRDSALVRSTPQLARVANITLEAGATRFTIWGMAFEGVKERPILGWGQANFNYVFNKYYEPSLYGQETWFDRVHNIVMDWLIAGGILGALAYFSIIGAALFYIFIRPMMRADDEAFSVIERGLLLGLIGGFVFHNLFVFDNLISYIFFGVILALMHSRVSETFPSVERYAIREQNVTNIAAPVVAVLLVGVIYTVNAPGIFAAHDVVSALRAKDVTTKYEFFDQALARGSFADQEIREQMLQMGLKVAQSGDALAVDDRVALLTKTEEEFLKEIRDKPGDARLHFLLATFYRFAGQYDAAIEQAGIARSLSPNKQAIIFEQGFAHMQNGDTDEALELFKKAYDLAPGYELAREYYALAALQTDDIALFNELIDTDARRASLAGNDMVVRTLYALKEYELLEELLTLRIETEPENIDLRVNLAAVHQAAGDTAGAIQVLEDAVEVIPEFESEGQKLIDKLRN